MNAGTPRALCPACPSDRQSLGITTTRVVGGRPMVAALYRCEACDHTWTVLLGERNVVPFRRRPKGSKVAGDGVGITRAL